MRMIRHVPDKFDTGMLNAAIGVEQLCPGDAGLGPTHRFCHGVKPASLNFRIVIQEKKIFALSSARSLVARLGKSDVFLV